MSSVEVEEVIAPIGQTRRSNAKISTKDLGPCMAFLVTFKHNGEDTAALTQYSHSMKNKKKKCGLIAGMWRREKNAGVQEKFFQNFRVY